MKVPFKQKVLSALKLFAIFFKIGLFSFGGGYAMLTMIEREVVDKHKFLTRAELMDIFAIAESTPGAVAINIATFIGTRQAGVIGGIFTTLGVVLPSFLIILGISYVIDLVRENVWVGYLFRGIRVGVLVLIARAVKTFFRDMRKDWYDFVLLIAAFLIAFLTDVSVIYIILGTVLICVLTIVIKNARIKKLHIITDPEEYQRKVCEEYFKTHADGADSTKATNGVSAETPDDIMAETSNANLEVAAEEAGATKGTITTENDTTIESSAQNKEGKE